MCHFNKAVAFRRMLESNLPHLCNFTRGILHKALFPLQLPPRRGRKSTIPNELMGGKDAKKQKKKHKRQGEDADGDEGEISSRTKSKRPRTSKKHLDSPNSYESAFPDDKQQKSLG